MRKKIARGFRISRHIIYRETLIDYKEHFWSFVGAFVGIGLIAFCQSQTLTKCENVFLFGAFGASSVLIYGTIQNNKNDRKNNTEND